MGSRMVQCWDRYYFLIFINEIDDGIISKIWKFADDSKMCNKVVCNEADTEIVISALPQFRISALYPCLVELASTTCQER